MLFCTRQSRHLLSFHLYIINTGGSLLFYAIYVLPATMRGFARTFVCVVCVAIHDFANVGARQHRKTRLSPTTTVTTVVPTSSATTADVAIGGIDPLYPDNIVSQVWVDVCANTTVYSSRHLHASCNFWKQVIVSSVHRVTGIPRCYQLDAPANKITFRSNIGLERDCNVLPETQLCLPNLPDRDGVHGATLTPLRVVSKGFASAYVRRLNCDKKVLPRVFLFERNDASFRRLGACLVPSDDTNNVANMYNISSTITYAFTVTDFQTHCISRVAAGNVHTIVATAPAPLHPAFYVPTTDVTEQTFSTDDVWCRFAISHGLLTSTLPCMHDLVSRSGVRLTNMYRTLVSVHQRIDITKTGHDTHVVVTAIIVLVVIALVAMCVFTAVAMYGKRVSADGANTIKTLRECNKQPFVFPRVLSNNIAAAIGERFVNTRQDVDVTYEIQSKLNPKMFMSGQLPTVIVCSRAILKEMLRQQDRRSLLQRIVAALLKDKDCSCLTFDWRAINELRVSNIPDTYAGPLLHVDPYSTRQETAPISSTNDYFFLNEPLSDEDIAFMNANNPMTSCIVDGGYDLDAADTFLAAVLSFYVERVRVDQYFRNTLCSSHKYFAGFLNSELHACLMRVLPGQHWKPAYDELRSVIANEVRQSRTPRHHFKKGQPSLQQQQAPLLM